MGFAPTAQTRPAMSRALDAAAKLAALSSAEELHEVLLNASNMLF